MSNVDFSEGGNMDSAMYQPKSGRLAGFLISRGIVKDERAANVILLGAATVIALVAIFFFIQSGESRRSVSERDLRLTPPPSDARIDYENY